MCRNAIRAAGVFGCRILMCLFLEQQKQDNSVGTPYKKAEQEMAPNTPVVFEAAEEQMLFPTHVQQEQEIAPHTPAVPEAYHHGMAVPSTNKMTHNLAWLQDLNEDGEGYISHILDRNLLFFRTCRIGVDIFSLLSSRFRNS